MCRVRAHDDAARDLVLLLGEGVVLDPRHVHDMGDGVQLRAHGGDDDHVAAAPDDLRARAGDVVGRCPGVGVALQHDAVEARSVSQQSGAELVGRMEQPGPGNARQSIGRVGLLGGHPHLVGEVG